eukprot:1151293-Pelagomonas_calceolata.AAC.2
MCQSQHFRRADTNLANPRTSAWFMKSLKQNKITSLYLPTRAAERNTEACNQTWPKNAQLTKLGPEGKGNIAVSATRAIELKH